jgi:uracil-DNA glycosylase
VVRLVSSCSITFWFIDLSLEQQLHFDISRCSLCPLGGERQYCSPVISSHTDTLLVLESPNAMACDVANAWRHPSAQFLSKAFSHACGGSLARFHLSFMLKCHAKIDGMTPPVRQRRDWAQVCATQYLDQEIKAIAPRQILFFGELPVRACFQNLETPWADLLAGQELLSPYQIESHFFESPSRIQKHGLSSESGLAFLERLHGILGGVFSRPDVASSSNLFELL